MRILIIVFAILTSTQVLHAQLDKFTLSGQIKDMDNGEDLIGATVYIPELGIGAVSNSYGFYSLTATT